MAAVLTERQRKWFDTVRANFEANTGKPMADWLEIMKTCPETKPRAQMAWLKAEHGVGQNGAAFILDSMKSGGGDAAAMGWDEPDLRTALWREPGPLAVLEAVEAVAGKLDGVISGQRKSFTSFSRAVQFAAVRPLKGGSLLLGLKLDPAVSPRLSPSVRKESWSERLSAVIELTAPDQVDADLAALFAQAADNG
jgi:hypothetical protein